MATETEGGGHSDGRGPVAVAGPGPMAAPADVDASADGGSPASLEYRPYDRYWEHFPKGTYVNTRGITITETHIVNWANLAGDWLPLHVDHHAAAQTPFRSIIAHGPLTIALALGLVIQSGFFGDAVIAWLGLDDVRLPRPVMPGDTIYVRAEVVEHAETSKPHRGRIAVRYDVTNQRDEQVLTFQSGFLLHRRAPAPDAAP